MSERRASIRASRTEDSLTDLVHALEPYAGKSQRDTRNTNDNIYSDGDQLLLNLQGEATSGFTGAMSIGLDLSDMETRASDINSGGPGGPGGGPPP